MGTLLGDKGFQGSQGVLVGKDIDPESGQRFCDGAVVSIEHQRCVLVRLREKILNVEKLNGDVGVVSDWLFDSE